MSGGFGSYGLSSPVLRAVEDMGYELPTEVQDEAMPLILGGGDVMVAAPTGSGKTAAFAVPIVELVVGSDVKKTSSPTTTLGLGGDRDGCVAVSETGLSAQSRVPRWAGARVNYGVRQGKWTYAVHVDDEGLVRVGWATRNASLDLGTDTDGYGYGGTGKRSHDKDFCDYGEPFTKGDVIRCFLDLDRKILRFAKNGNLFDAIPLVGDHDDVLWYPSIALKNAQCTLDFSATADDDTSGFAHLTTEDPLVIEWEHEEEVVNNEDEGTGQKKTKRSVSAIVLEPARDLAEQTHEAFVAFAKHVATVECRLLIGGIDCRKAERDCAAGRVDIVTGTPRKVLDVVKRNIVDVKRTKIFVLDEADRYAETKDDAALVMEIFSHFNSKRAGADRLQVCFFSATLHADHVRDLAAQVCAEPTWIDLKGPAHLPENVKHLVLDVAPANPHLQRLVDNDILCKTDAVHRRGKLGDDGATMSWPADPKDRASEFVKRAKPPLLVQLLDQLEMDHVLVFCRTNLDCDLLEKYFAAQKQQDGCRRYSCSVLAGGRDMHHRRRALDAFKAGDIRILLCTDVAARGIDVSGLPFVVNVTLPDTEEAYIHRVGRVGRADNVGLAISLVATVPEYVWYCQKGRKPPQSDTRLYDEGGNCIWYDESTLLAAVEARLGGTSIPRLRTTDDIVLPKHLQALHFGSSSDTASPPSTKHVAQLATDVDQLKHLEAQAQRSFFALLSRGDDAKT